LARINAHLTNHKLHQQLQEEKIRFQALSEATFEGILIHEEGRILELNQTLEKMFGYHRSEALGRDVLEFVRSEFHQLVLDHIRMKDETPYQAEGGPMKISQILTISHQKTCLFLFLIFLWT
jgi:PAS domain-containing protein